MFPNGKHVHTVTFRVQVAVDAERLSATTARLEAFLGQELAGSGIEHQLDVLDNECQAGFCAVEKTIHIVRDSDARRSMELVVMEHGVAVGKLTLNLET